MTKELETENFRFMNRELEDMETCSCEKCGTVYQIRFLGPGENYNDFGIWFCPYCAGLVGSVPHCVKNRAQGSKVNYVLITISGGIIGRVKFYREALLAITALSDFVKTMDSESEDGGVYGRTGLIANAKDFLDENDEFAENTGVYKRI